MSIPRAAKPQRPTEHASARGRRGRPVGLAAWRLSPPDAHDVAWWGDLVAGHGLELNEEVARAHLKPGYSFFGDGPHA